MTYIEGFVTAVPTANKDEYRFYACKAAPLIKEFGAQRMVECWGDDVPSGELTDFKAAVAAKDDETVVFSWLEYSDKETRDAANTRMRSDQRLKDLAHSMPFDGKRMIYGGFNSIFENNLRANRSGYTDGYLLPVPEGNRDAYLALAAKTAEMFSECGATRVVEAWSDDVAEGERTDLWRAVKAEEREGIVFSFVEWPDKETRDAGWQRMMSDERLQADKMPFDGKRMVWGGFTPLVDTKDT